jgi:hypothetical protein
LLLICGSSLTVIAILCIVTFLLIREHANAQAATRSATTIAQLIDADVLRTVELYDLTLQGLIAAAQRDDLRDVTPQIRHLALFDRSTTARFKGDILLLDKHGDVVADSSRIEPKPGNFADRDYFLPTPSTAIPACSSAPVQDPLRLRRRQSVAHQLQSADLLETGEFAGVAVASMKLDYFDQLFNSLDIGKDSTLNIINSDGVLLAQKPHLQNDSIGKSFGNRPNVVRILGDKDGSGSFTSTSSMDHQQRLYTYSRVGNLPLTVMVALSSDEVFGTWRRTALLVSGATGVLCAGLLWLTWLLAASCACASARTRTGATGCHRCADRRGQPADARSVAAPRMVPRPAFGQAAVGDDDRCRPLQGVQRPSRASGRRSGVARTGQGDHGERAPPGDLVAVMAARVLGDSRRDRRRCAAIAEHIRQAVEQMPKVEARTWQ